MLVGKITETRISGGKKETTKQGFSSLRRFNEWAKIRALKNSTVVKMDGSVNVEMIGVTYGAKVLIQGVLKVEDSPLEALIKASVKRGDIASVYNDIKTTAGNLINGKAETQNSTQKSNKKAK